MAKGKGGGAKGVAASDETQGDESTEETQGDQSGSDAQGDESSDGAATREPRARAAIVTEPHSIRVRIRDARRRHVCAGFTFLRGEERVLRKDSLIGTQLQTLRDDLVLEVVDVDEG